MPVPSLKELTRTRLIQNIHNLTDIGDLPYDFLASVLRHIQNPSQLLELEQNSPQIVGETGEIWLRFIKRDIPNWEKKGRIAPKDPRNWSRLYRKLKREAEQEREDDEKKLREQINKLQQSKAGNQTKIIESRVPIDPSARSRGFSFARGGGGGGSWGSGSGWGSGAPAKTGKVAFDKLRRGIFDQKRAAPKAARMPAHLLAERKGTVAQAPARMVRMAENQAGAASRPRPQPTQEQQSQNKSAAGPEKSGPSLPAGVRYNAPRLQGPSAPAAQAPKRKREEPNMFMQRKKR